jgi:peroxiredoxin
MDTPIQHPCEQSAPEVGEPAPDFTLPDESGALRALSHELREGKPIVLFFMRGEW